MINQAANTTKLAPLAKQAEVALAALEALSTQRDLENLARFGITASHALGVSMPKIQKLAKRIGRNHELAAALWNTGCYEARLLTAYVAEPARVTSKQMDRWCKDFDNWAVCDTFCLHLFDRVPHAWSKIRKWSAQRPEFVRRAAFALIASIAGHDKRASDEPFLAALSLIERAACDERNFVKKAVSWALRRIGRRNRALHRACVELSARLSASSDATERWIGRDAYRELTSVAVERAMHAKSAREKTHSSPKLAAESTQKKKAAPRARRN